MGAFVLDEVGSGMVEPLGCVLELRATRKFYIATLFGADLYLIAKHLVLQPIEYVHG